MKAFGIVALAAVVGSALYVAATVMQVLDAIDNDLPWFGDDD